MLKTLFTILGVSFFLVGGSRGADLLDYERPFLGELQAHRIREDPTPKKVLIELGEKLFFDPRLSGSGRTSCSTCHDPNYGWAEPQPTSIFDTQRRGPRNALSILNTAFFPRLMWDGRFGSLEEQAFGPFTVHGEMGITIEHAAHRIAGFPEYQHLFHIAYSEPPTPQGIVTAIAAFERTIVSGPCRFDRFYVEGDGRALSPFEQFGYRIFTTKGGCVNCHVLPKDESEGYPLFTDFAYHNLGVGFRGGRFNDVGVFAQNRAHGNLGAFRTPSLRNVAVTGPYMHDGSLETLRDVVEFYNAGGGPNPNQSPFIHPLGLSDKEKAALVAFLGSLTSVEYERGDRISGPRGRPFASRE